MSWAGKHEELCDDGWTMHSQIAEANAKIANEALNAWAIRSLVVVGRGKNVTPHDPDRP